MNIKSATKCLIYDVHWYFLRCINNHIRWRITQSKFLLIPIQQLHELVITEWHGLASNPNDISCTDNTTFSTEMGAWYNKLPVAPFTNMF